MASIEFRGSSYRMIFRYAGAKFSRSLKTDNLKSATASCARLEDNVRRLEQGLAALPEGPTCVSSCCPTAEQPLESPINRTRFERSANFSTHSQLRSHHSVWNRRPNIASKSTFDT